MSVDELAEYLPRNGTLDDCVATVHEILFDLANDSRMQLRTHIGAQQAEHLSRAPNIAS